MDNSLNVFFDEYGLFTSFTCGDKIVDNVQIVLNFSEIIPSKITGKIVGNPLKYNEIIPLLQNRINNSEFSFNSSKTKNQRKVFSSNEIQISKFTFPMGFPSNFVYDVLPFELGNLTIIEEFPTNQERAIQFLLEGPRRIWGFLNYDVIDNKIIPKNEINIEIDEKLDFKIKLEVFKHNREDEKNKSLHFEYETIALIFVTNSDTKVLSDEAFIDICIDYIKGILLLVSFLGKKRIEWFCYNLYSDNKITTYIRDIGRIDSEENDLHDYIIGRYGTLKFLKKHLPVYRKLRYQNFDLSPVIIYYLSSLEMAYLESEFATMFTALEYLKSLYSEKNNLNEIISNNRFKKLNKIIKQSLYEFQKNNSKLTDFLRDEQIKKIPELNRYSISSIISKMCSEYEINLEEFYPADESISLYNTRNKLIHESYEVDIELLSKEYVRLRLFVEKLILKILEYEDFDELENKHDNEYITESESKINSNSEVRKSNENMNKVKALIVTGFGINCEEEMAAAYRIVGADAEIVHLNDIFLGKYSIHDYDILNFPGGFSFGDDLGSGKVLSNKMKFKKLKSGKLFFADIQDFLNEGKFILGVCNGFQFLVKMGLLPNVNSDFEQEVTLTGNNSGKFEDRWVHCKVNNKTDTPFLKGIEKIFLPVRHGEGKLIIKNEIIEADIMKKNLNCLTYCDKNGNETSEYPMNPNGSALNCAGLIDKTGHVLGLMPHPEAFLSLYNHPNWGQLKRDDPNISEDGDGLKIFKNIVEFK